ncbi:MAG: hypothetical protein LH467_07890 [Gemmatimonadaceae bacterium]|nr:hypothetical protein [Gemmatimonadaceae bacterium]
MRNHLGRVLALTAAAMFVSGSANAQGKSQEKSAKANKPAKQVAKMKHVDDLHDDDRRSERAVMRDGNRDVDGRHRDGYGNGVKTPPGLAKKPGGLPPGQYKKRYGTNDGADILGGVLRRRGYSVLRVVPAGDSRYVFYRLRDGREQRAIVSPGSDRLRFQNVPASLLQEVLTAMY